MSKPTLCRRINTMHLVYGTTPGKTCKTCANLLSSEGTMYASRTYYKCMLSKMSHGSATDWRIGWPACGRYEESND